MTEQKHEANEYEWQDWLDEQEGFGYADEIKAYIRELENRPPKIVVGEVVDANGIACQICDMQGTITRVGDDDMWECKLGLTLKPMAFCKCSPIVLVNAKKCTCKDETQPAETV